MAKHEEYRDMLYSRERLGKVGFREEVRYEPGLEVQTLGWQRESCLRRN